jgi:phosphate transport system substrate-binding protein
MTQARLQNADGDFVLPSAAGATAAAAAKPNVSPTGDFSIVNQPGKDATPIAGYSWVIVYKDQTDKAKGQALVDLLYWMVKGGQQYAIALHYAQLPSNIAQMAITSLRTVTSQGTPLLTVS